MRDRIATPHSEDDAETRIRGILARHVGVDKSRIRRDASWSELNIDSLSFIAFIVDLQDEFGIEIPDAEAARLASLADVVASVRRYAAPATADESLLVSCDERTRCS
jgi:acyl carrier protein